MTVAAHMLVATFVPCPRQGKKRSTSFALFSSIDLKGCLDRHCQPLCFIVAPAFFRGMRECS
jgi:hypothetical protein